jgi:hypothetical protein
MILFTYAGTNPRAMMIKFSYAFSAIEAMFGSILNPTIAYLAIV